MVKVTRLNGNEYYVNPDLVQFLERTPETVLTFTDGKKQTVKESPEEIIAGILEFRRQAALPPVLDKREEGPSEP